MCGTKVQMQVCRFDVVFRNFVLHLVMQKNNVNFFEFVNNQIIVVAVINKCAKGGGSGKMNVFFTFIPRDCPTKQARTVIGDVRL